MNNGIPIRVSDAMCSVLTTTSFPEPSTMYICLMSSVHQAWCQIHEYLYLNTILSIIKVLKQDVFVFAFKYFMKNLFTNTSNTFSCMIICMT